jgi:Bacterial RNA polymerase, alpha chain C terminal domain
LPVKIPPAIAHLSIEELDLSVRSYNALKARRINNLAQLLQLADADLLDFENLGRKSLEDVKRAIAKVLSESGTAVEYSNEEASLAPGIPNGGGRFSAGGWNTPPYRPDILDTPIDLLDLSARPTNVLAHLQVVTVRQLLDYPKRELARTENIGRKSMAELEAKLFSYLSGPSTTTTEPGADITPIGESPQSAGIKEFVDAILSCLPDRQRKVLSDRYGLWDGIAETLQDSD